MKTKTLTKKSARLITIGILLLALSFSTGLALAMGGHGGSGGGGSGGGGGMGGGGSGGSGSISLTTFTTSHFSGSGNCAVCHSGLIDSTGADVSIDRQWRSTMMANSAKDPLWQAKIESEVNRSPALQAIIEDKCSRCHAPMARVQAVADGTPVAVVGSGFLNPTNPLHAAALDGVSCSLCHQIQSAGLGTPATFTGQYIIDTSTIAPDRLIFGKFTRPLQNPMRMNVGYTPVQGSQTSQSGLCGSCHTLYTPIVDSGGNVLGEFPEQMTYPEWEHSQYGDGVGGDLSCQACHTPVAAGSAKISNRPTMLSPRSPFDLHTFIGGNAFMLSMLKNYGTELGLTASTAQLDTTLSLSNAQLQSDTASLQVTSAQVANGLLNVNLSVQNQAGHKLPSGVPLRRAWIYFTVKDKSGRLVFESGQPLTDGNIAGNDMDENAATFEPHYDLISAADQVQIYESVMLDSNNQVTYTLLRAAQYSKDNRLLPLGFDKNSAGHDIAVVGAALQDNNFLGGSDTIMYQINLTGYQAPYTVNAQLLFQTVSYPFARDLQNDASPLVDRFVGYYSQADHAPVVLAQVTQVVR